MRAIAAIMVLLATVYGCSTVITVVWTLTGHCCGSPVLGVPWDNCLPVQDKTWYGKRFASGHCDEKTWKRVP
jgi:hypothetical protein